MTTLEANTMPVVYKSFHDFADGLYVIQSRRNPCDQTMYMTHAGMANMKTARAKSKAAM
jgi:hypothetical protein